MIRRRRSASIDLNTVAFYEPAAFAAIQARQQRCQPRTQRFDASWETKIKAGGRSGLRHAPSIGGSAEERERFARSVTETFETAEDRSHHAGP